MKKKGFTLVELLAVIVVLAIVAVIAIPTVASVLNTARKGVFKSSVLGLIEAGDIYRATGTLEYDDNGEMIFNCGMVNVHQKLEKN